MHSTMSIIDILISLIIIELDLQYLPEYSNEIEDERQPDTYRTTIVNKIVNIE